MVKALAASSEAHFITVDAATLNSRWFGEAEKGLRLIFKRAKQIAPCILFFDEIDALAPVRAVTDRNGTDRLVSQLLLELDSLMDSAHVIVIAATNRPDMVDPALMRPGRFDFIVELPLPGTAERSEIFKIHTAKMNLAADIDFPGLIEATEGAAGSAIEAICKHAALAAMKRYVSQSQSVAALSGAYQVLGEDFSSGLRQVLKK